MSAVVEQATTHAVWIVVALAVLAMILTRGEEWLVARSNIGGQMEWRA